MSTTVPAPFSEGIVDLPVDGYIYGEAPPPFEDKVPDVQGMFEAAGVPLNKPGELPFSLEWYAGAKDRQKARDEETDRLLIRKNDLRHEWSELIWLDLEDMYDRVAEIAAEPEPLDLAIVLARAIHERPRDKEEADLLREMDAAVQGTRERLRMEISTVMNRLKKNELGLREEDEVAELKEEQRLDEQKADRRKKAKSERALKRNEARLRGETATDTDEEEAEIEAQEAAEDVAEREARIAAKAAKKAAEEARRAQKKSERLNISNEAATEEPSQEVKEPAGPKGDGENFFEVVQQVVSADKERKVQEDKAAILAKRPSSLGPAPKELPPAPALDVGIPDPSSRGGLGTQLPPLRERPAAPPLPDEGRRLTKTRVRLP